MDPTPPEGLPASRDARESLCPDGRHEVRASANAASALRALDPEVRGRIVEMLCDVAEVAALAPGVVDFRRLSGPFLLRAGRSIVVYMLDGQRAVTVEHVIDPEALPRIA